MQFYRYFGKTGRKFQNQFRKMIFRPRLGEGGTGRFCHEVLKSSCLSLTNDYKKWGLQGKIVNFVLFPINFFFFELFGPIWIFSGWATKLLDCSSYIRENQVCLICLFKVVERQGLLCRNATCNARRH